MKNLKSLKMTEESLEILKLSLGIRDHVSLSVNRFPPLESQTKSRALQKLFLKTGFNSQKADSRGFEKAL